MIWRFGAYLFMGVLAALTCLFQPATRAADDDPEPPTAWPKTVAADRNVSINNLKAIGLAFHNFHDAMGAFPCSAIRDKTGKPLLSWRVALLPYLEEDKLYREFKLDEPWDSKNNKPLLARMPKVYLVGKPLKANTTHYQVFAGAGTLFDPKAARGQGIATLNMRLTGITDGTSNTALVVEADKAVLWSKPDDVEYDAKKPLPKLGGLFKDRIHILLCDGSTRRLGRKADGVNLRRLITPNDGEILDWNKLPEPEEK